ncbi:MAG TPA: MlaD family protein [Thermoleophilaceae bacterium]|nr:MlaD family protein [Thermoleophilaceae bacterium]
MGSAPQAHRSGIARLAALAAVIAATVFVALLLFGGGGESYTLKARFVNAGQLVRGNLVELGGVQIGQVTGFEVADNGQAEVEFELQEEHAPLPVGSRFVIRPGSLSSVANRFIEVHLPSASAADAAAGEQDMLEDGSVIQSDRTTSVVEIDTFFSLFDKKTRESIQGFFRGGRRQYAGAGDDANRGLPYLKTSLSASSRLFRELTYDPVVLERFLVDSSRLVTALAEKEGELSPLVNHLNRTTRALGSEKEALAEVVTRLPGFMRTANSTYVNLRAALDDVDPLVEASKPVARKLGPFLDELRPFANEAVPTVRDLARLTGSPGPANDLLELNRTYPPLADIAVDTERREIDFGTGPVDLGQKRGSFPEAAEAFRDSAPIVAHGRPYTPDFVSWFDDFSQTGAYDALGSFSRSQTYFNVFTVSDGGIIPRANQGEVFKQLANIYQYKKCPGAAESPAADGSNVWSEEEREEFDCLESDRSIGAME